MGLGRIPGTTRCEESSRQDDGSDEETYLAGAQDVKAELAGRETYEYHALAELVGVAKSTWTETYLPHWLAMRNSFKRLDSGALISVTRSRSQQKATNSEAQK
ncbi:phage antitermination protein Q [Enterobacter cloacae]|uniref:Phage antitermination protein Q n=1 Tax=Enterobacter cloacae TaxID=550 RepID=A0A377LXL7_ENTCL|nr:phage antitermination protein Q [Enterobacter cloacae]